eukprot:534568-Rhodomonas_salina.2
MSDIDVRYIARIPDTDLQYGATQTSWYKWWPSRPYNYPPKGEVRYLPMRLIFHARYWHTALVLLERTALSAMLCNARY